MYKLELLATLLLVVTASCLPTEEAEEHGGDLDSLLLNWYGNETAPEEVARPERSIRTDKVSSDHDEKCTCVPVALCKYSTGLNSIHTLSENSKCLQDEVCCPGHMLLLEDGPIEV